MANPGNKASSMHDFAPAWLKLPEQREEKQSIRKPSSYCNKSNGRPPSGLRTSGMVVPKVQAPPEKAPPVVLHVEEDFPCLHSTSQSQSLINRTSTTWSKHHNRQGEELASNNGDGLVHRTGLTSNMSGKVYRAQVRPVRRGLMIPLQITSEERQTNSHNNSDDKQPLSSSVEKEKRLLQEMGWKEDDTDDEECEIPEQDPAKLQEILQQAKAAREQLLLKSKRSLKPITAVLPNDNDLSSSDNSDAE